MLEGLEFSVYKIIIRLKQTAYFGFKERFDFLKYLQRTIKKSFPCNPKDDCLKCKKLMSESGDVCDYPFIMGIFYPPGYKDNLRKPFVLLPPTDKREIYAEGEELEFHLTLIGKVNTPYYLAKYFAPAFEMLGCFSGIGKGRGSFQKLYFGRYDLVRIYGLDSEDKFTEIFAPHKGIMDYSCKKYSINNLPTYDKDTSTLEIGWRTPFKSDRPSSLSFEVFWSVVYQRLQPLNFFFGDGTRGDMEEWNRLKELSKDIASFEKEGRGNEMLYKGRLEPFLPYIIMASYLHTGKQVSNGYGSYFLS